MATVGIAYATLPIIIALLAHFMLRASLPVNGIVGVIMATLGMILGMDLLRASQSGTAVETLLIMAAVICAGFFTIIGKRLSVVLAPIWLSALVNSFGAMIILPLAVEEALYFRAESISLGDWSLLLLWATASCVCYLVLWHAGLCRVEAHSAGAFTGAAALVAVICSSLIGQETVGLQQLGGLALVIGAVVSVSLKPKPESWRYI